MTVNRGLWVPINTGNVGTTEVEARLADNATYESNNGADARPGLLNPQTTTIVTGKANMSYDIAACNPVTNRVAGEGVYRFAATGVTNIATTAAPSSNSRIDVIWVKQNDQSKGDANNLAVAGVTQGTVAASPTAPTIPAGALELARSTVTANITATTSATITQTFRYTSLKGAPTPVRNTTERAEITAPRVGQSVARLDLEAKGLAVEVWNGSAWTSMGRPPRHVTYDGNTHVGNATGLAAKVASGEVQLVHYTASFVTATDASGYLAHTYPAGTFPNGILAIQVSLGDSAQGAFDVYSVAGTPFSQSLTTFYGKVQNSSGGRANVTVRFNIDAWGW